MSWPYLEDDFMEIGNSGWMPYKEKYYKNIHSGHIIDENGIEYDEAGNKITTEDILED
jgi:hypothetical protein